MPSIMLSRCSYQRYSFRQTVPFVCRKHAYHGTPPRLNISRKYLEKIQKRAEEHGITVDELKQKVKENKKPVPLAEAHVLREKAKTKSEETKSSNGVSYVADQSERRDKSPVKPLAEIMDVHKILRKPHTAQQISALWTAFHASRSGGTGRGYLSASVPVQTYDKLIEAGKKYPTFILPLLRDASQAKASEDTAGKGDAETAYEFFFMQWAFHPAPAIPTPSILDSPLPEGALPSAPVHPISTVLFTPLLEYKTHATFATPHLVLTMYPDLAQTHQLVLLRGELTPSPTGSGRYLLSQQDAQLLALGLQRFYLAHGDENQKDTGKKERAEMLRKLNEKPEEFRWEELLRHANPTS